MKKPSGTPIGSHVFSFLLLVFSFVTIVVTCPGEASADDKARIKQLERQLFRRTLSSAKLEELLRRLSDPSQRAAAMTEILRLAKGCQKQICLFARSSPDIAVREACADIVQQLDDGWRTTPIGREFDALCKTNSQALFPQAWDRFRKDATDQAACAMILAADPESVWTWIEKRNKSNSKVPKNDIVNHLGSPTEADRGRYLMLRIRDLSPDRFAATRLPELPKWSYYAYAAFPEFKRHGCYRVVGHVRLKRLELGMEPYFLRDETFHRDVVHFFPKQYMVFRFDVSMGGPAAEYSQLIQFEALKYGPYDTDEDHNYLPLTKEQLATPMVRPISKFGRSAEQAHFSMMRKEPTKYDSARLVVPKLFLSSDLIYQSTPSQDLPAWWWKRYLSDENARRMKFAKREPDSNAPAEISNAAIVGIAPTGMPNSAPPAALDAPSFAILPPRLSGPLSEPHLIAAELACDRLAEELTRRSVQIVDRRFLQQVLKELELGKPSTEPLTGFDAFVRLQVDNDQLNAKATVSVISLSTGNSLVTESFAWPIEGKQIDKIRKLLDTAITQVQRPESPRLKIRLLGTQQPDEVRLEPLATQLTRAVEESLRRDKQVVVVDHIEAGSAAEESLLILMGLARLPGDRQFGPMADATLAFQIKQLDAVGKTFANTKVEVRSLLQVPFRADIVDAVEGTVSAFETEHLPNLWKKLSVRLRSLKPGDANASDDLAGRKLQAARELAAIRAMDTRLPASKQALARRRHAQTALKLDPTSEDAFLELVKAHAMFVMADVNAPDRAEIAMEGLDLVADRLEKFASRPEAMHELQFAASNLASSLNLMSIWYDEIHRPQNSKNNKETNRRICDTAVRIAEVSLSGSLADATYASGQMLEYGFKGLKACGVPKRTLQIRLSAIIGNLDRLRTENSKIRAQQPTDKSSNSRRSQQYQLKQIYRNVLCASSALGLVEEYDRVLPIVLNNMEKEALEKNRIENLRRELVRLGDPKRLADFNAWAKSQLEIPVVSLVETTWPNVDALAGLKIASAKVEPYPIDVTKDEFVRPLTTTSDRMYFVVAQHHLEGSEMFGDSNWVGTQAQKFGFLPLDANGKPSGPAEFITLPAKINEERIACCVANEQTVVIGTTMEMLQGKNTGLYAWDVTGNQWTYYGVGEGLPANMVSSMHLLSDDLAICTGRTSRSGYACFTFDLRTRAIRHYANGTTPKGHRLPVILFDVYEENGIICGFSRTGWWHNLLSAAPVLLKPKPEKGKTQDGVYYSQIRDACRIQNDIFFVNDAGLHKARSSGEVVKTWKSKSTRSISPERSRRFNLSRIAPSQSPIQPGSRLVACDGLLLLWREESDRLTAYDPTSDTWLGPITIPRTVHALADGQHVWLGGSAISRLPISEIISAARRCKRSMTTDEFAGRQNSRIEKMRGLDRAKTELAMGRFAESKKQLDRILAKQPNDANAHYVTGVLYDTWGLNQPEKAEAAYQRVARSKEIRDNRSLAFSAAYLRACMLQRIGREQDAAAVAKQILSDYPRIDSPSIKDAVQQISGEKR